LIRRLAKGSTVLLSTHILSEVEATCDRVIILMNGQVKADARLEDLATTADAVLVLASEVKGARPALLGLPAVESVDVFPLPEGFEYRVRGGDGADLRGAIYDLARQNGWPLRELRRDIRTLETVFNELAVAEGAQVEAAGISQGGAAS